MTPKHRKLSTNGYSRPLCSVTALETQRVTSGSGYGDGGSGIDFGGDWSYNGSSYIDGGEGIEF